MKKLLTPIVISLLLLTAVPTQAKNLHQKYSENTKIVRDSLILKGINAYKTGNYQQAIQLLKNSLSHRKVVATPREIAAFNYLALTYQEVGETSLATKTINWAISFLQLSPIELAELENTAGMIADRQNKKVVANQHWEKARQLYLVNSVDENWAKVTINLANNYRELGNVEKYQQLLKELEIELDSVDSATLKEISQN